MKKLSKNGVSAIEDLLHFVNTIVASELSTLLETQYKYLVATVFATWFGSETVLGIPARFAEHGLGGTVEDPFGASLCLIFVGLF